MASLIRSSNANIVYTGYGNEGTISSNVNSVIDATDSVLNLYGNTNSKVLARYSYVTITHCTNLKAVVKEEASLEVSNSTNSRVTLTGSDTKLVGDGNTNSHIKSRGSNLKLVGNTNTEIDLTGGEVTAEDNVRLSVTGVGGNLTVTGTRNHNVCRTSGNDLANKIDFSLGGQGTTTANIINNTSIINMNNISIISNTFNATINIGIGGTFWGMGQINNYVNVSNGPDTNDVKISLEYVDEASIDYDQYTLGIFEFTVTTRSKTEFELKMNENNLDQGSLEMLRVHPWHVVLSGSKNGKKQTLDIVTTPSTGKVDARKGKGNLKISL